MRRLFPRILFSLFAAVVLVGPAAAQDVASPVTLGAEDCTVDPIDPDAYNAAIEASIPPLPAPIDAAGEPADETTVVAVTETIRQSIACTNVGDLGRLLAVLDPSYAPTLLGVPYGDVPAAIEAAASVSVDSRPATPLVDDLDQGGLVTELTSVEDVRVLSDASYGEVAATATLSREGFPPSTVTIYLQIDDDAGRYIITNYAFHPGEMPVATPEA